MRTSDQINDIKERQSNPVQFINAITKEKIDFLIDYYKNTNKIQKNTGPQYSNVKEGDGVVDDIIELLRLQFGNFTVRGIQFFNVEKPHIIHIDDKFEYPRSYKAFAIPLEVNGNNCNLAKLIMFNQYYYGGPAKFVKGSDEKQLPVYYNKYVTDYNEVENKDKQGIPLEIKKLMTHLRPLWTHELSVQCYFPWTIGSIIAFDSLQLHCASDFTNVDIKSKLGMSIFTTWEN